MTWLPVPEKCKPVEPYRELSLQTGYERAPDTGVRELYGIEGVRGATVDELDERLL